jgi:hypothetical protein
VLEVFIMIGYNWMLEAINPSRARAFISIDYLRDSYPSLYCALCWEACDAQAWGHHV